MAELRVFAAFPFALSVCVLLSISCTFDNFIQIKRKLVHENTTNMLNKHTLNAHTKWQQTYTRIRTVIRADLKSWKWWITWIMWITYILLPLTLYVCYTLNGSLAYSLSERANRFGFETRKRHISTSPRTAENSASIPSSCISYRFSCKFSR